MSTPTIQERVDAIGAYLWELVKAQNGQVLDNLVETLNAVSEQGQPAIEQLLAPIETAMRKLEQLDPEQNPEQWMQIQGEFWQALSLQYGGAVQAGMEHAVQIAGQGGD